MRNWPKGPLRNHLASLEQTWGNDPSIVIFQITCGIMSVHQVAGVIKQFTITQRFSFLKLKPQGQLEGNWYGGLFCLAATLSCGSKR